MKLWFFMLFLSAALILSPVLAAEVTLKTSQGEYQFQAGEEARVPFVVHSTFPRVNVGTLEYSLTKKEAGSGYTFSQTSSQSQSFPISPGSSQNAITLSSDDPAEFEVTLTIRYRDDGKEYASTLPPFIVRFLSNQRTSGQAQPQSGGQGSSELTSTTREMSSQNKGAGMDPFAELDQQMEAIRQQNQQIFQQAFSSGMSSPQAGGSQGQQPQQASSVLQNNQLQAPTSALQKQLAEEAALAKQEEENLISQVSQDPLLNQVITDLTDGGLTQDEGSVSSLGDGAGTVKAGFSDPDGRTATLSANVRNGSVQNISVTSPDGIPIPSILNQDERYVEAHQVLQSEGFNQTGTRLQYTPEETRVEEQYQDQTGKNATLTAVIRNGTVEQVIVKKEENLLGWYVGILLLVLLVCVCSWAVYAYTRRPQPVESPGIAASDPVSVLSETERLLGESEQAVRDGRMKEAYIYAGQALRYFISHTYGTGASTTTEEVLAIDVRGDMSRDEYTRILTQCALVEYAKGEGSSDEITSYIRTIRKMIQ